MYPYSSCRKPCASEAFKPKLLTKWVNKGRIDEDYIDGTCPEGNTHYIADSHTILVNKPYYGISLGVGARLLFKDIFYWTPAFYFGTHFNALDEPFYKLEIFKFGARIQ